MPTAPLRITARALFALSALAIALLLGMGAARAHTQLMESSPADGADLKAPPDQIVLIFEEAPLKAGLAVVAQAADGTTTPLEPRIVGAKVVAPWPAALDGGSYEVNWRVVSADGHPLNDALGFTNTSASAMPSPSASPTVASPAEGSAAESTTSATNATRWIIGGLLLIATVIAAVFRLRKRNTNKGQSVAAV